MDITALGWFSRYIGKGVSIPPAVEAFYKGELDLFDESLGNVEIKYPRLNLHVQDFRARIIDPFMSHVILVMEDLPRFERDVNSLAEDLESKGLRRGTIGIRVEELMRLRAGGNRLAQEHIRVYNSLVEVISLDDFNNWSRDGSHFSPELDVERRNEIYRRVLNRDDAYRVLGADVRFLNKFFLLIAEHNAELKRIYDEEVERKPKFREIVAGTRFEVALPQPLNSTEISATTYYEGVFPRLASSEELRTLSDLVEGHFRRRVDSIWG